jgi:hypothetical protein
MAVVDFQRALADMTLDARLASAVRSGRPGVLAAYTLTERERRRLHAIAQQDGMSLTCSLARANRFGSIHDAFTMTCVLLGPALRGLLDEVWSQRPPDNYQLSGDEVVFAALLERAIADGAIQDEYLDEGFRYERLCWELAMEVRLRDGAAVEGWARTTHFRHDPGPLLDALAQHRQPPEGLRVGDYRVTVRITNGDLVAEWDVDGDSNLRPSA